jgi:cell division protein DivIC
MHDTAVYAQQPKRASENRGARRRVRFVLVLLFAFIGWAVMAAFQLAAVAEEKLGRLAELEARLADVRAKNEKLKLEIIRLNDPEYIEQRAKADFQMVRDGETLFKEPQ